MTAARNRSQASTVTSRWILAWQALNPPETLRARTEINSHCAAGRGSRSRSIRSSGDRLQLAGPVGAGRLRSRGTLRMFKKHYILATVSFLLDSRGRCIGTIRHSISNATESLERPAEVTKASVQGPQQI